MAFTVPESVRSATTKCRRDFSCLEAGSCAAGGQCLVEYAIEEILFVRKSDGDLSCPYQIPFGHGLICSCPTHAALRQLQKNPPRGPAPPPGKTRGADI